MRVLVCGGRDYTDYTHVKSVLDELKPTTVIHGNARGADTLASQYARENKLDEIACPANWDLYGKSAGVIRNGMMLKHEPDLVVAFPGGPGTAHMVSIATAAGFKVRVEKERG